LSEFLIERAARLDAADAARFASIYETSFPPSERDDTADLLASIDAGERLCYLARLDRHVVGIAVAFALDGPSVVLLEYLAVDASQRNAGIGGSVLSHLTAHLSADAGGRSTLVLEVEPPDDVQGPERTLRGRRLAFYERHGASVVECAPGYRAPDLEREGESVPYVLLSMELTHEAAALRGSLLRDCIVAILTQSYGLDADDPLVKEVVDGLAC